MADERGMGVPVACGALGQFDPDAAARIADLLDPRPAEVHRDERSILFLDREPSRWETEGASGLGWCECVPDRSPDAATWVEAASLGACGLARDPEERVLHASGTGLGSVYWMRADGAVYFASQIDALARAGLGPLSPDWQTWTEILALGYPMGEHTPFAEIARLEPAGSVALRDPLEFESRPGRIRWADADPLPVDEAAERVVAGVRAQVAALEAPIACPLTGGWDSRLIACALAEAGLIDSTYTVSTDQGVDLDESLGGHVAAYLGVPHQIVDPELPPFAEEIEHAAERVEYQTILHLPMNRLAGAMPRGGVCADGIGGDVLIKGLYVSAKELAAPSPIAAVFDRFVPDRLDPLFEPPHWGILRESARPAFMGVAAKYLGHPSEASLSIYAIRTHRMIGSSPMRIVGRHRQLFMPLVSDPVARAALSIDPREKLGSRFYRDVLASIAPGVERLPSTNDGPRPQPRWKPRHRSHEAQAAQTAILARSPLRPWFGRRLQRRVEAGDLGRLDTVARRLLRLQAILLFTLWCERYRDLIGEPDPSEIFGPAPKAVIRPSIG